MLHSPFPRNCHFKENSTEKKGLIEAKTQSDNLQMFDFSQNLELHSFLGSLPCLGHFVPSQFWPLVFIKLHMAEELKKIS